MKHANVDIAKRLRSSVKMDAPNGDSFERQVCAHQMLQAAEAIEALQKAARLIFKRHAMESGSLEMHECDAVCKAAGLEVWTW